MSDLAQQNLCTICEVFSSNYGQVTGQHSSSVTLTHACMLSLSICLCLSLSLSVFHICTAAFLLCLQINYLSLTLMISESVTSFSEYNQQDAAFLNLFIPVRCPTCFRRFFCPSSGASSCTHSVSICQTITATCC